MAKGSITDFLQDRSRLALRLSSKELGGLLRRSFTLPPNTAGLATFLDGEVRHLREGQELRGTFDLVLAKRGVSTLRFDFPSLPSADGASLKATAAFSLELAVDRAELFRDFLRGCFNFPGTYTLADLETQVAPEVRRVLAARIAASPVAGLHRCDAAGLVGGALQDVLERSLFDAGIRFVRLLEISFVSEDYERRQKHDQRSQEDERLSTASAERREQRVRRVAGLLKDQQLQGALAGVPDPKLRGLLYAKLMEDDSVQISAEDLLSKAGDCGEEVVQSIYRALEGLLSNGANVAPDEVDGARAERVFAAAGAKVFEIRPGDSGRPRVLNFPDALRSIRAHETPQGPVLLGGSKIGVALLSPDRDDPPRLYPLSDARPVKGGINAIAMDERWIWATHSEYGLTRWETAKPEIPGERLLPELTRGQKTTRAVQVADGRLLFATGHHVYAVPAAGGGTPVKYVSSVESPVSCIAAAARTIFAGTESGSIVCWKADAPDQPVVLVRKREPIVTLGLARLSGIPHLVYSARDLSLRARVIGQNLETSYETDGSPVGVLDAASDLLCAVDADGRRVHLWKASEPAHPSRSIDLWREGGKPVLDLCIRKGAARTA